MLRQFYSVTCTAFALAASACSIEASDAFDFETATPEARLEWLTPKAAATAKGISDSLNGYGGLNKFEVSEPAINVNRGVVTFDVRSLSQYRQFETSTNARRQMEVSLCNAYMDSPFARVGITNVYVLKQQNGNQAMRLNLTPSFCTRLAETA